MFDIRQIAAARGRWSLVGGLGSRRGRPGRRGMPRIGAPRGKFPQRREGPRRPGGPLLL